MISAFSKLMTGASSDLSVGGGINLMDQVDEETKQRKKKAQQMQRDGSNQMPSPYSAAFMSLNGNQF